MIPKSIWLAGVLFVCPIAAQKQGGSESPPDVEQRLSEFREKQRKIIADWSAAQKKAREAAKKSVGGAIPSLSMRPDFGPLVGEYLAAVPEYRGDDVVKLLLPTLHLAQGAQIRQIVDILLDGHLDSKLVGELGRFLPYLQQMTDEEFSDRCFEKIVEHGKNARLLGWLELARGSHVLETKPAKSEEFQKVRARVADAVEKAGDPDLKRDFETLVAEKEKFSVGMVAPDIEGIDLDGVPFKLSDYKGKVIFLDFWGDW